MLQFTQFEKRYSSEPVISIPKLSLKEGIYWLQGENGAGKTTLLKTIAGLIPFSGKIEVNDINIRNQRTQYRMLVNWADAEPLYPDFLTGIDLVSFYQQTKHADQTQIHQLIQAFGIDKYYHQKVSTYSSGMTKKLSLVLAFIGAPKWILLDEPLITLDTTAIATCLSLIHKCHQKGVSFLITSHQSFLDIAPFTTNLLKINDKTLQCL
ncbi:MAG TPA: ABC transporter ATP-binding protein [Flavisolibacter sp.]|nr:ABC transporter ATP-binding protein [Flavisolibacter sp.]